MQTTDFRDEDEGPPPFASLPSTGGGSTPPPPFTSMPLEVIINSDSEISSPNLDDPIQSEYTSTSADTATSQPEETTRKKMIKGMIKGKRVLYTYMESMKSRIRFAKKRENV
ncbi:hypothetical protein PNOK_0165300 [Pyrrhoderma noxium]|uniref:Uncharacterized protein n=1 Tax=Pyrrhoderma noxium TaxID=2282107 RepID=A0A286UQ23_9AGAM|nr:hypothetical protein PNOK_0165300 [Pyrrhoderma noxium]